MRFITLPTVLQNFLIGRYIVASLYTYYFWIPLKAVFDF
jgi:hypothetical protein